MDPDESAQPRTSAQSHKDLSGCLCLSRCSIFQCPSAGVFRKQNKNDYSEHASESDDDSLPDSEADYSLEKGHEEYIAAKGVFRGFFERIKKVVKRKPKGKQKEEETGYDEISVPHVGKEDVIPNIGNEDEDDIDYELSENLKRSLRHTDEVPGSTLVTAMYDFKAFSDDEISFSRNDRLKLYGENIGAYTDWCLAEHLTSGRKGYIPHSYVTGDKYALQARDWWFDIDRNSAEILLKSSSFPIGTFLVRTSDDAHPFILSILVEDTAAGNMRVQNYPIRSHLQRLYISARRKFSDLPELIQFYQSRADGLSCKCGSPPPKKNPLVYPRSLIVERKTLDVKEPFTCGKYGKLFNGTFSNTFDVTIVELTKGQLTADDFLEEARILFNFRFPEAKIVKMIAVGVEPEPFMIVIGETIHGTLKEYLQNDRGKTLNFMSIIRIASQIADGMAILERNGVVHKELKAAIVFVCDLNVVKIAHPKLTEMMLGSDANRKLQETKNWKWTAPEAVNDDSRFSTKTDVWSYGILLYELITFGEEPYNGFTAKDTLDRLEQGFRLQKPSDGPIECPIAFYVTILKCWHRFPECRPTFDFLREFFLDYDVAVEYEIGLNDANIQDLYMRGPLEQQDSKPSNDKGKQYDSQPSEKSSERVEKSQTTGHTQKFDPKLKISSGFSVKALYDFTAEMDEEISFQKDGIITEVEPVSDGSWLGTAPDGKRGHFPANYVEVFENSYAEVTKL